MTEKDKENWEITELLKKIDINHICMCRVAVIFQLEWHVSVVL